MKNIPRVGVLISAILLAPAFAAAQDALGSPMPSMGPGIICQAEMNAAIAVGLQNREKAEVKALDACLKNNASTLPMPSMTSEASDSGSVTSGITPNTNGSGASCPKILRTLFVGSTGDDVVALQVFLIAQGDLAAGNTTGYFGVLTEAAVKAFQSAHGIENAGMVGPKTRAAIAQICGGTVSTNTPSSSGGSTGNQSLIDSLLQQIKVLQEQIKNISGNTNTNTNTNTTSTNTNTTSTNINTTSSTAATPQTFDYMASFHSGPQSGGDQSLAPYFGQNPSGPWWYGYADSVTGATKFMSWDGTVPSWIGGYGGFPRLYNWGGYVYGSSAIIVWVAPRAGTVTIAGSVSRQGIGGADATCSGATPIVAYVYQDGKALWSASMMPGDAGKAYSLSGTVNQGSNVSFIMQPAGASPACNIVYWNPTVVLK
ncbi:peptidoglycan-binding protein [Candidatus Kaiserbacteria bacterium]|nr:peptidoglycan-binding protein [Candidatus Kaiserbacteria bacterium]